MRDCARGKRGFCISYFLSTFKTTASGLEHILNTIHQVQLHSVQLNLEKLQFKQTYQTDTGKG